MEEDNPVYKHRANDAEMITGFARHDILGAMFTFTSFLRFKVVSLKAVVYCYYEIEK